MILPEAKNGSGYQVNTQEELQVAFEEFEKGTFIKHK